MKNTVIIYALCEQPGHIPIIRYIGVTNNLTRRLSEHETVSIKQDNHLGAWLRLLKTRGEAFHLLEMCEVEASLGPSTEMLYIRLAREGGMDLVNSTDGGEGITMTPEIREKIGAAQRGEKHPNFGKTLAPEHRAKIGASNTGEKHWNFGKKTPPETRVRISRAKVGRSTPSFEARIKMSAAQRLRNSVSNKQKQEASVKFCPRCKVTKDKNDFNKRSVSPDGLHNWCRACGKQANCIRYQKNLTIYNPVV